MYHASTQGVDERMINVPYYYYHWEHVHVHVLVWNQMLQSVVFRSAEPDVTGGGYTF